MKIKANGKEYNLEYTFEAALDTKCVDMCWNYFSGAYVMKGQAIKESKEDENSNVVTFDKVLSGMVDMPSTTVRLFYAGLLENHSDEIKTEEDAKELFKAFRRENKDDERATFTGMFNAIREQMEKDGFFQNIGLQDFMDRMKETDEEETENGVKKAPKIPQDHKKKAGTSTN